MFWFEIVPALGADPGVWVIFGDIPPAFIDVESCPNGATAVEAYVLNMEDWVDAVLNGESTDDLIPVRDASTFNLLPDSKPLAEALAGRLRFIRRELLSQWESELK